MKSVAFIGEAKSLCKNVLSLSFEIKSDENKAINANENTIIPGAKESISKMLTGIFF